MDQIGADSSPEPAGVISTAACQPLIILLMGPAPGPVLFLVAVVSCSMPAFWWCGEPSIQVTAEQKAQLAIDSAESG